MKKFVLCMLSVFLVFLISCASTPIIESVSSTQLADEYYNRADEYYNRLDSQISNLSSSEREVFDSVRHEIILSFEEPDRHLAPLFYNSINTLVIFNNEGIHVPSSTLIAAALFEDYVEDFLTEEMEPEFGFSRSKSRRLAKMSIYDSVRKLQWLIQDPEDGRHSIISNFISISLGSEDANRRFYRRL